jgi:periplasmic copper chaperone A
MEGDVMKMRQISGVDLPAGALVELKPGGYHLMLMDLKRPVLPGSTVPLTLIFKDAKGVERRLDLNLKASTTAPGASGKPAGKTESMSDHKH